MATARTKQLTITAIAVLSLGALVVALQQFNIFAPNASSAIPDLITVSNLTDSTATIVWRTAGADTLTNLQWGTATTLGATATDFRDARDKTTLPRMTHYVQLSGLKPNTTYYYRVVSGDSTYPTSDLSPLSFKTLPKSAAAQPTAITLYGDTDSQNFDTIVLTYAPTATAYANSLPQATTLNPDGTWMINISASRKADGTYIKPTANSALAIIAFAGDGVHGFVGTLSSLDNPYSIPLSTELSQATINQLLLTSTVGDTVTPTTTTAATPTPTSTVAPTVGSRQDVPLRPIGSTPTTTPISSGALSREQLLASFSVPSLSNVTDSSLSIMFLTSSPAISTLNWGTTASSLGSNRLDDQDSISASSHYLHHFTLTGLSAGTKFYFKSAVENTVRTFTTPFKIAVPSGQTIITGTLKNANGECLVRTQIKRSSLYSSPITTLPNASFAWAINVMPVRVNSLDAYFVPIATDTVLTSAFCMTSSGSAYYQTNTTTVQQAVTSGITLSLTRLQ